MTPTGVIVNEHSRRFSRTLQQAFPVSEGYREAIEGPTDAERRHALLTRIVDLASWGIVCGALLWIGWQAWKAPKVPW